MSWSVVINAGQFDVPLHEFRTKTAAEIYYLQVKILSKSDIEIKNENDIRYLQETFFRDDILIDIDV